MRESGSGFTRKRLLGGAARWPAPRSAPPLVAPAVSLGPVFDTEPAERLPLARGPALVDEHGKPLRPMTSRQGPFYTAFPEGADKKAIAAPLVLVRLDPAADPAAARLGARGHRRLLEDLHARRLRRRAVSQPEVPADRARPALVCPCHYSTFDPADAGSVLFGPAGRPLPQLPLTIVPTATCAPRATAPARPAPAGGGCATR